MKPEAFPVRYVEWIWRHIGVSLPADWEMLQFSTDYDRGRCAFADRYRYRAELSWKKVAGAPDYNRMVSDYLQRLESEKKIESPDRISMLGWHGFSGQAPNGKTSRLGKYLPACGCLVELVLIWPEMREAKLEENIIASIREHAPGEKNRQRWRAFGMQIDLPAGAVIAGCSALPGLSEMNFVDPAKGQRCQFTRAGMIDAWFDGNIERWLQRLAGNLRDARTSRRISGGREIVALDGSFKPEGLHLRPGRLTAAAWIAREDHRLYAAILRARKPGMSYDDAPEDLLRAAPEFVQIP